MLVVEEVVKFDVGILEEGIIEILPYLTKLLLETSVFVLVTSPELEIKGPVLVAILQFGWKIIAYHFILI